MGVSTAKLLLFGTNQKRSFGDDEAADCGGIVLLFGARRLRNSPDAAWARRGLQSASFADQYLRSCLKGNP
jgi:hypothetical protein